MLLALHLMICIPYSGKFSWGANRVVNAKIKTGINSHPPVYAGAKPIGGCGLLALTRKLKPRKFLLRALGAK